MSKKGKYSNAALMENCQGKVHQGQHGGKVYRKSFSPGAQQKVQTEQRDILLIYDAKQPAAYLLFVNNSSYWSHHNDFDRFEFILWHMEMAFSFGKV